MQTKMIRRDAEMIAQADTYAPIKAIVLDAVSERTRRDYGRALDAFIEFWDAEGRPAMSRRLVQAHVADLKDRGVTASSINQRLAAIRKLAAEAAENGIIDSAAAAAIARVPNIKRQGQKLGNWLTKAQAEQMVNAPDVRTLKGLRDRAIIGVMLGCGLRRSEVANLAMESIQQREGRWVIADLEGKHGRVRTVGMAPWVKNLIDVWAAAAGIARGYVFVPLRKGGRVMPGNMSSQAIWKVVAEYAPIEGLAPHDLRRTYAKLAAKGGAGIDQIQVNLGHASIQTTERYLGIELDLSQTPSDCIDLDVI